jgi:hypothetical protein
MALESMTRPFTPTRSALPAGPRFAIDSLVQASLVELFDAYGVALAPLPAGPDMVTAVPEVSVAVTFRNNGSSSGRLTLSVPGAVLDHMKSVGQASVRGDWARELGNQLLGRIKNRLLPFGARLEIGQPSLVEAKLLQRQLQDAAGSRAYVGRTLRGLVLVTVQGLPESSSLVYVRPAPAAEGTLLWL